jgi:peroxiredoxin
MIEAGQLAPDFGAEDLTGERFYLSALRGQVVLLTFFATWCEPCKAEIPLLVDLARQHAGSVRVVCVVIDADNKAAARAIASALAVPYPLLVDEGERIKRRYGVGPLPATFLIDGRGRVRSVYGALTEPDVGPLLATIARLREPR